MGGSICKQRLACLITKAYRNPYYIGLNHGLIIAVIAFMIGIVVGFACGWLFHTSDERPVKSVLYPEAINRGHGNSRNFANLPTNIKRKLGCGILAPMVREFELESSRDWNEAIQRDCWSRVRDSTSQVYQCGLASWYSRASCKREGTSGIMTNGRRLEDEAYTCAIWDYPFGAILEVTNLGNNLSVEVEVTDRGPAKRLVKEGKIIDLSKAAFRQLAPLGQGLVKVSVRKIEK